MGTICCVTTKTLPNFSQSLSKRNMSNSKTFNFTPADMVSE